MRIPSYASLTVLVLANLLIIAQYFYFGWSDGEILLLFWIESAIVGFYTILKMMVGIFRSSPDDIQEGRWPGSKNLKQRLSGKVVKRLTGKA